MTIRRRTAPASLVTRAAEFVLAAVFLAAISAVVSALWIPTTRWACWLLLVAAGEHPAMP